MWGVYQTEPVDAMAGNRQIITTNVSDLFGSLGLSAAQAASQQNTVDATTTSQQKGMLAIVLLAAIYYIFFYKG